jgi:undecaprenyl diphosphate synthase
VPAQPSAQPIGDVAAAGGAEGRPRHVAVIMDGNGRWAQQRSLPRIAGHRAGVEAVRRLVRLTRERQIEVLTLYSFSTENWSRPEAEVSELMRLLRFFIRSDLADLHRNNVQVRIIGEREGLAPEIVSLLEEAESTTAANTGLKLVVAFNYGARQEMARAVRHLAGEVAAGRLSASDISADRISAELDTRGLPDPDLIIRTSGEQRISNFLLWQAAYAEFVFLPILWPDFDAAAYDDALGEFARRQRRFGGV